MSTDDKRLTKRLIEYWNRLRKELTLPPWEQFNSAAFEDVWRQCCGWRVESGDGDVAVYTYEYVGDGVKQALGMDPTGQTFNKHFHHFAGGRITQRIGEVVKTLAPVIDEGQFVNEANKIVKYRSCLLPFGTKERNVTHIVLGLSWKEF